MLPNMRSFISLVNRNIIHGGRSMEARRNFCSTPENSYGNVLSFHPSNSRAYVWCICIRREHQKKKKKLWFVFVCVNTEINLSRVLAGCFVIQGVGVALGYGLGMERHFFYLKFLHRPSLELISFFFLCIKVLIYIPILDLTLRSGWKR